MNALKRSGVPRGGAIFALLLFWIVPFLNAAPPATLAAASKKYSPPKIMREFRGAWIASYANIDWPSKPGLSAQEQKAELTALMDKAVALRLNALLLQVRPACDSLYSSKIEPWSEFLTGEMGKAPEPFYDPLKFAIDEAHRRGLELHAWFNPYRAGLVGSKISSKHITKTRPELVRRYGKYYWLDPGEKAVQDYTTRVILDVVRRYDIDGVHMDDYFYPYPENNRSGQPMDFPDSKTWNRYKKSGGKLSREDWRRQNVNQLVQRLQSEIKRQKKWVVFGVSPFGIWRPGFPAQIKGFDAFDKLYADARQWTVNGWVDYLAPQLYWQIDPPAQSYSALYNWWREQNKQMHIWPGNAVTRVAGRQWGGNEIVRQIQLTRTTSEPGHIHWNLSSLVSNPDNLQEKLIDSVYQDVAIGPANKRGTSVVLPRPGLSLHNGSSGEKRVKWMLPVTKTVPLIGSWIVQTRYGDKWHTEIVARDERFFSIPKKGPSPDEIVITAVDRFRNLSPGASLILN